MPAAKLSTRLILAGAVLAFGLLLAEFSLRLVWKPEEFRFRRLEFPELQEAGRYRRHLERFFELAPDFQESGAHRGRYALASWPFRGPPPEPCPPDVLRVLVVGDSCVYGSRLDGSDTLPHRLAMELASRGLGPERVQVLNLGQPGYSTVQLETLLAEQLPRLQPDAVVLYPASWNDQAPALQMNDLELRRRALEPEPLARLRRASVLVAVLTRERTTTSLHAIRAAWEAGAPLRGMRVSEEQLPLQVEALIRRCRDASAEVVVVSPCHPPATRQRYARTGRDAATVARVATAAGVPLVDGQAVLEATGEPLQRFFADHVHPSPEGAALLAEAVAAQLAPTLAGRSISRRSTAPLRDPGTLRVLAVDPAWASCFGDERVRVLLDGWQPADGLPQVEVGGVPLHALQAVDGGDVEGLLVANAAGLHDIVVRTASAVAVAPRAFVLVEPRLVLEPGPPAGLVFRSRPGDRCQVFAGARRELPEWTDRGAWWLAPGFYTLGEALEADETGAAGMELPAGDLPAEGLWLQGLVVPGGDDGLAHRAGRWTPAVHVTGG